MDASQVNTNNYDIIVADEFRWCPGDTHRYTLLTKVMYIELYYLYE